MATKRIPILGPMTVPDTSGNVYFEPASSNFGTNDLYPHLVLVYADAGTRNGLRGLFEVPQDYVDTAEIIIVWSSTLTGPAKFDFDYTAVAGDNAESIDPSADQQSSTVTDTISTARRRHEATIDPTDTNFVAGDTVLFELFRHPGDAGQAGRVS